MDFKKYLKSKAGYNIMVIFIDQLSKRPVIILIRDIVTAKELAPLFLMHVIRYIGIPDLIILDQGP